MLIYSIHICIWMEYTMSCFEMKQ